MASIRVFYGPPCNDRVGLLTIRPPGSCPLRAESAGFPPSGRRHFLQNARSVKSQLTQSVLRIAFRHGATPIAKLAARDKAVGSTPTFRLVGRMHQAAALAQRVNPSVRSQISEDGILDSHLSIK